MRRFCACQTSCTQCATGIKFVSKGCDFDNSVSATEVTQIDDVYLRNDLLFYNPWQNMTCLVFFVVYALVLGDFNASLTQQRNDLNCNERRE